MTKNNEYQRIIEKLKKSLETALDKFFKELEVIEQIHQLRQELSEIDSLETLIYLKSNEIMQYLFLIDSSFNLDKNELEKSIAFYEAGIENPRFKNTTRFTEAEEYLRRVKEKFDEYIAKTEKNNIEKELTIRTNIETLETLNDAIGNNNEIIGEIDELYTYLPLLDENWTEAEKITLFSMLVKAHIENLKNGTRQNLEEIDETQRLYVEEQAAKVELEMQQKIAESQFNSAVETTLETEVSSENLCTIELSEETLEKIEELKQITKKSIKELYEKPQLNTKKATFDKLKEAWDCGEMTYEQIFNTLKLSDMKLFLAHIINKEISDIESMIAKKTTEEEIVLTKELIIDSLRTCATYAKMYSELDEKIKDIQPPVSLPKQSEESPMKLIFYTVGDGDSEFEKTLNSISKVRIEGYESLLYKLEQGNFKTALMLTRGNDNKLRYVNNHNIFITFKVLPNNHVLVYHIAEIETINKKSTDVKLRAYSMRLEKKISEIIIDGTRFAEGTLEYRQLISENKTRLETIKKKNQGMKRGDSHA